MPHSAAGHRIGEKTNLQCPARLLPVAFWQRLVLTPNLAFEPDEPSPLPLPPRCAKPGICASHFPVPGCCRTSRAQARHPAAPPLVRGPAYQESRGCEEKNRPAEESHPDVRAAEGSECL